MGDRGSAPGPGRSPGEQLPTLLFLPGEFHGQRSLVGYSSWGKELDMTEQLTQHFQELFSNQNENQGQEDYHNL